MNQRQDLAAIAFTGKDAGAFLHNQLTQDILSLSPGQATFAALCQPKGRVMALLMIGAREEGYVVLCHAGLAEGLANHLQRFIFREQVHIDRDENLAVLSGQYADGFENAFEPLPGFHYAVAPSTPEGDSEPGIEAVSNLILEKNTDS